MKSWAKILVVLLLWTSQASAWDTDNCQQDLVFDTAATAALAPDGVDSAHDRIDPCGHCTHMSAHLLGCVTSTIALPPVANGGLIGAISRLHTNATLFSLFHPPRSSFV